MVRSMMWDSYGYGPITGTRLGHQILEKSWVCALAGDSDRGLCIAALQTSNVLQSQVIERF